MELEGFWVKSLMQTKELERELGVGEAWSHF